MPSRRALASPLVAALPMYDWPEVRAETDGEWTRLRDTLRQTGVDAPEQLSRSNADLPPVPGGIRDAAGRMIAPDPARLPSDNFDLFTLWRHPRLLLAQTCWGPMEGGLEAEVTVVGQPDYSAYEGGSGELYSSALLMRTGPRAGVQVPFERAASLPLLLFCNARFAFNGPDSMSGRLALARDLQECGESLDIFFACIETGSHRASIRAVAENRADICAVDCRSWSLAQRFEPAAAMLAVVGWTGPRKGLPFIASRHLPADTLGLLRAALQPGS